MLEIYQREKHIDSLFEKIKIIQKSDSFDLELISEFTKYLCVLISGHLEKSIYMILFKYSVNKTSKEIMSYVNIQIKNFNNAKIGKIETLLEMFNVEWKNSMLSIRNYDKIKGSVNSLVTLRHAIAHGNTVSLSLVNLKDYYSDIKKLISEIEKIIK